ncbi:MAG: winged helix-turn-helix transcriptional regulator [Nitrospinaceae bacterium]|jgi:ArsR family transcriptional regulator, arsenate/arsenite/antimonite-responsive transcriptional repressor|nr:winged helix-turn-helix transcriptional regulator [Nitrospinaceae bacterium]MBT4095038.1 winged helix-turn-helix transcriptional regulator [Nitrospinaceae bacterium]MBT4431700.1 winged helix-turn-helix transcriptional regulator [Nitrospinaceae bacterium]MBT5368187.1 winged helix-turn-helix transcriptional regulator [Nitrospinaceae bacterium]MBT6395780.1 winged helix-turn-helix transcriptional regulator [Nitrospinaceae bacterium]
MKNFLAITKALSDVSRVRALMALKDGELCLCQLIELLELSPSTVSKHMSLLLQADLLEKRKEGRWHFYRLASKDAPIEVKNALKWMIQSLAETAVLQDDSKKLATLKKLDLEELCACYRN